MSADFVSYVPWLYATALIRDGINGDWLPEEAVWLYRLSLRVVREASKCKAKEFTESFLCSLACLTTTANFANMFAAAELHCNALVKATTLKGGGDLLVGFLKCTPWTQKAIQWCEFGVAAQNRQPPSIPYTPPPLQITLPHSIMREADHLTMLTVSSLLPISHTFFSVFRQLHQLALSQECTPLASRTKIDNSTIRPLCDMNTRFYNCC
ncbi:hypothetical protein K458DRAFT_69781 [Lentithecium fluviatile CBS 122367]|uniref:Transcription factor domain-containing protein n=1 Tax=Lentithecium fluviatile CBS 122367 TaxID=1168545 RepID=A0A6G1JLI1_9PLEO|nr:hypothetical protein K458DRAFT_69781 [Lentithecium fluviatile CBS 122367]